MKIQKYELKYTLAAGQIEVKVIRQLAPDPCRKSLHDVIESCDLWSVIQRRVAWLAIVCRWIQNKATCTSIKGALTSEGRARLSNEKNLHKKCLTSRLEKN